MDRPIQALEADFENAISAKSALGGKTGTSASPSAARRKSKALEDSERGFRELLGALPAPIYMTDAKGAITYYNEAAAEFWGYRPELGRTDWCGSWKLFTADGTPLPHDQCPMAIALGENRRVRGIEAQAERPDGTRVPFMPYPTPLYDRAGKLTGAVNMLVDISEQKRAEQRHEMLVRELHHRVKNTLATVQAIMSSTARDATSIEDFQEAFTGRIICLSNTHSLLTEGPAQSVKLEQLLHKELDPFDDGAGKRIVLAGGPAMLPSSVAVLFGMAIHELTVNSARFGSLSQSAGSVEVEWEVIGADAEQSLDFRWSERNGPAFDPPARQGFGSRMLRQVLTMQAQAKVDIDFDSAGLQVHIVLPLR